MKRGDEAAFPQLETRDHHTGMMIRPEQQGATMREHFALAFAAGMVSHSPHKAERGVAEEAVKYADALLAELAT